MLAHLFFNELVYFCRSTADNPLLECTPPNNAESLTGPPSCSAPPSPAFILGDVSGDGTVDISDIVLIVAFVIGKAPLPGLFAAGDINGDGIISVLVSQSLQDFAGVFSFPPLFWCARLTPSMSFGCTTFCYGLQDVSLLIDTL